MNTSHDNTLPASSYGFHCVLQPQTFVQGVARVTEPDIGLLLPRNVVVREDADGRPVVGYMDPVAVLQLTSDREVGRVAHEVRERLERVRAARGRPAC
jgi:hypothetical protein